MGKIACRERQKRQSKNEKQGREGKIKRSSERLVVAEKDIISQCTILNHFKHECGLDGVQPFTSRFSDYKTTDLILVRLNYLHALSAKTGLSPQGIRVMSLYCEMNLYN